MTDQTGTTRHSDSRWFSAAAACIFSVCATLAQAAELINDGWSEGQTAAFLSGFTSGDMAAARFVPPTSCPCLVDGVRILYGGLAGTRTVRVHIWEDGAASPAPGAERYNDAVELSAANDVLQVIDLRDAPIAVNGPFRVGIEFLDDGFPSIARDTDGDQQPDTNFVFIGSSWAGASDYGISDDFIIRASLKDDDVFKDGFE